MQISLSNCCSSKLDKFKKLELEKKDLGLDSQSLRAQQHIRKPHLHFSGCWNRDASVECQESHSVLFERCKEVRCFPQFILTLPVWSLLTLTVVPGCQFIHFLLFLQRCNFLPFLHFSLGSCGVPVQKPTCSQSDRFLNLPLCKNAYFDASADYEMMDELMGRNA